MSVIQHIAFTCHDVKAQESFYTRHFGFHRSRVFQQNTPNEFVMLRLGSVCLELFPPPPDSESVSAGPQQIGFQHLAFEVPDLDAAVDGLVADGIEPEEIIDCSDLVPGLRICFFEDPDGNRIELMQGYCDQK